MDIAGQSSTSAPRSKGQPTVLLLPNARGGVIDTNPFAYFESITAARSLMLTAEQALEGNVLISLETQTDLEPYSMYGWVESNFGKFLELVRKLSPLDQDLLLSYFIVHRTQTSLSDLFGYTQSEVSSFLRLACKKLGFYQMFGEVSAEKISPILDRAGLEYPYLDKTVRMSSVIESFDRTRCFQRVADQFAIRRPDVRRSMSQASLILLDHLGPAELSLGAILYGFTHRLGTRRKGNRVVKRRDPDVLGQFHIQLKDQELASLFVPRADI